MDENPKLPDLHQSEVDESTLRQLFSDLSAHAKIIEVIPKHGPGYVAGNPEPLNLNEAQQQLLTGAVRGLQVRYLFEGKTWWDTLMPLPGGLYRVVRIEHDFGH